MSWFRSQWDRASAAVLFVLGLVTLLLGYLGASSTPYPAEQLPYMISGGVLGIFFLGSAAALYISADLRDEWRKLNSIDASLKAIVGTTTLVDGDVEPPASALVRDDVPAGGADAVPAEPARRPAARTPAKRAGNRTATSRS